MKTALTMTLLLWSLSSKAADIPTHILGADEFDEKMCIENNYQRCLSEICITSTARDCPEQCRKAAQDKCAEQ